MVITIINSGIVFILILLFLLCMLEPVKRLQMNSKFRFIYLITKYHSVYAWLLLILSLVHGFLAEQSAASISGKIVWILLLLCIVFAYVKKKMSPSVWKIIHISFSIILAIGIIVHIVHAIFV